MSVPDIAVGLPRRLRKRMRTVWHGNAIAESVEHEHLPVLVTDWGSHAQPQSRRAESAAEPYLRRYLADAESVGRAVGRMTGFLYCIPIAVLLVAGALLLPGIG